MTLEKRTLSTVQALSRTTQKHKYQNTVTMAAMRDVGCTNVLHPLPDFENCNLLLAQAFPGDSPMHPAYGAGHATVAGGCVTIIKAYFEMFQDHDSCVERVLCDPEGNVIAYIPNVDGTKLVMDASVTEPLRIQGELDKLAANIAIARNMAGVHDYSDYYDSLRLGERVAVGLLLEQAPTYGDAMEMTFTSFDGDFISLIGRADAAPTLTVVDRYGSPISRRDWWLRHVPGEQLVL